MADFPDWLFWKAQLFQESRLDPAAVSPAGARGLAQLMPGTRDEVSRAMGWGLVSVHDADLAIEAGAFYMAKLRRAWRAERPQAERHRLAQASYNAGLGNIVAAQRRCHDARLWDAIAPCLKEVTGARNAHETTTYVERIQRWRLMMEMGL